MSSVGIDKTESTVSTYILNSIGLKRAKVSLYFLQVYVRVYDNGQPALHDTKILTVTVKSNFFAPQFFPRAYERVVLETWNIEDQLFDLNATDSDLLVSIVQTCLRHYLNLPVLNTTC